VAEVIDRWQEPDRRCFTVRDEDAVRYVLRYHEEEDEWSATPIVDHP
jgi:hypothetical protein